MAFLQRRKLFDQMHFEIINLRQRAGGTTAAKICISFCSGDCRAVATHVRVETSMWRRARVANLSNVILVNAYRLRRGAILDTMR